MLLKGPGTVVAAPDGRAVVNRTGRPRARHRGDRRRAHRDHRRAPRPGVDPFDAAAHRRVRARAGGAAAAAHRPLTSLHPTSWRAYPVRCRRCAPDAIPGRRDAAEHVGVSVTDVYRPVWAEIDLDAVRANVRALRGHRAPAALLAVVKADGYGHGAVPVARAALEAGATWLGVALVEEGVAAPRGRASTRRSSCCPSRRPTRRRAVVAHGLTPVVYTRGGHRRAGQGGRRPRRARPLAVHLKVDTGMHRVGCRADDAVDARRAGGRPRRAAARRRVHALRRRRRARQPVHRRAARALRRRARRRSRARGLADRHRARAQHRRRDRRGPPRALRPGARRHRRLRHRAAPTRSTARVDAAPGAVGEGAGLAREDGARPARGSRTGCATRRRRATRIATVPIGYADGVPRELPRSRRRGARAAAGGARSRAR